MPRVPIVGKLLDRRAFLRQIGIAGATVLLASCTEPPAPALNAPAPSRLVWSSLPRWRGFSLDWKAPYRDKPLPFVEWDFDFMAEHGFDFVRLAVDYRRWTPQPGVALDAPLRDIDQAIAWARERKIHAELDLHNAPGYNNFSQPKLLDLWSDGAKGDELRRQFAEVWRGLAARYRAIPSSELSFNLLNEPPDIAAAAYLRVIGPVVDAIRAEDPDRVLIADGLAWGRKPVPELAPLRVAQATHAYQPFPLTHYRASWIAGANRWPVPTWPLEPAPNEFIVGPLKRDFMSPLVLRGEFPAGAELRLTVQRAAHHADLVIRADGATIFRKLFKPGPGEGEWRSSTYRPQYNDYEALYDRIYAATLPAAARELRIEVVDGDWLTFSELRVRPWPGASGNELVLAAGSFEWGVPQDTYTVDAQGKATATKTRALDKDDLWRTEIEPWKQLESMGVGVHVGEWGAHNETPHEVVLRWMADQVESFRRANWGWALWNLRGSFGPVDSGRRDVRYEDYKGHKLDRAMLEILLRR